MIEQQELMEYLDGEVSPERAAAIAAHVTDCQECRKAIAGFESISRTLSSWHVEPSRAALPDKRARRRSSKWRVWTPWVLAVAASIACVVIFSVEQKRSGYNEFARLEQFGKLQSDPVLPFGAADRAQSGPKIVRTADLVITTDRFGPVRSQVEEIVRRRKGYVGRLQVSTAAGSPQQLTATLNVPADRLNDSLADLKTLGHVDSETQTGQNVTAQYIDLDARLGNALHTEQRLTALLQDHSGRLTDVLNVEKEIDRVRGEIERMEAEKKSLDTQLSFASIELRIVEAAPRSGKFGVAVRSGYRNLLASVTTVISFILSIGPTVLFWLAILYFPARYAWKRRGRHKL